MSPSFQTLVQKNKSNPRCMERRGDKGSERQKLINTVLFLTLVVFGLGYLIHINTVSTRGITLRTLQKKKIVYQKENEQLGLHIIESQSLNSVQKKIDTLQLVRSEKIEYVTAHTPSVAVR